MKMGTVPERRHDIDWLRVLGVLLLIPFHTGIIFAPSDSISYVKDQPNAWLSNVTWFMHQWHMPLLFLVSGAATWFSLGSRAGGEYIRERFNRLIVPLIFGTLAIVPPQVYWQRVQSHQFRGSYIKFYPHFFDGIYPTGNFSWGNLWFLAYLFTFSLIALRFFFSLRNERGRRLISALAALCERRGGILLFGVPLAVVQASLRARWPGAQNLYNDWANFFFYITFFVYGYLLCSDERFKKATVKNGRVALVLGVVAWSIIDGLDLAGKNPVPEYSLVWVLYMILSGFNSWFWMIAILAFGQRYLNFTNRALRYATEAALPFYIIHHTVIVTVGYYVVKWNTGTAEKFLSICAISLVLCIFIYDALIKRISILRFLFGMRTKQRQVS